MNGKLPTRNYYIVAWLIFKLKSNVIIIVIQHTPEVIFSTMGYAVLLFFDIKIGLTVLTRKTIGRCGVTHQ